MATYLTKCTKCENICEVVHKMSEDHPPCEKCGAEIKTYFESMPTFHLKGEGWASKELKQERDENRAFR